MDKMKYFRQKSYLLIQNVSQKMQSVKELCYDYGDRSQESIDAFPWLNY